MHGHPFSGPMKLWWGHDEPQPDQPRNLFYEQGRKPPPDDMFRAGGRITMSGEVNGDNRDRLHALMVKLDTRMRGGAGIVTNPCIPSGYTYLLQFIAHDMVDSVPSFSAQGENISLGARNVRSTPLHLDTLYGSGPEEATYAYEFTADQRLRGLIPRTRLRAGRRAAPQSVPPEFNRYCPFRDVARNISQTVPGTLDGNRLLSEVMLADPRNDAHALISQLTILFQLLHNHVLSLVEGATKPFATSNRLPPRELAYRQFNCARTIVTLIYHSIVEKDVLRLILDKGVYRRYVVERRELLDRGTSIPLEFASGAFRFGHAMVREEYSINSRFRRQRTTGALERSAMVPDPTLLPIKENWFVDWAHFFEVDADITPNLSSLIRPRYPAVFSDESFLWPPKTDGDVTGLLYRDLLSSAFGGLLSVPALIRTARERGFDGIEDFENDLKPRLRAWLSADPDPDMDDLANDPPLPFFVLFEAARIGRDDANGGRDEANGRCDDANGGQRLGPLGSVIVAEAICGALRNCPLHFAGASLKERIDNCGRSLFVIQGPDQAPVLTALSAALSEIDEITSMPELIRYMARAGLFEA